MDGESLTIKELAELSGLSPGYIRAEISRGKIAPTDLVDFPFGKQRMIPRSSAIAWLKERGNYPIAAKLERNYPEPSAEGWRFAPDPAPEVEPAPMECEPQLPQVKAQRGWSSCEVAALAIALGCMAFMCSVLAVLFLWYR